MLFRSLVTFNIAACVRRPRPGTLALPMKEPGANEDAADPSPNAKGSGSRPTGFAATTPMSSALAQSLVRGVSHDAATVVAPDSLRAPSRGPAPLGERFRLGDVIGAGGMGEVRLFQDQWIGRDVAMKTLHPELAVRGDAKSRFLREIRVQGQLEHPSTQPMKAFSGSPRASMHARARAKEESTFRPSSRPYVFARLRVLCRIASRRPKTSPIAWSIDHRDPLHEYRLRAFAIHLSDEAQRHVECGGRSDLLTGDRKSVV